MGSKPTLTIYHLTSARSTRIMWLLEELNQPYNIVVCKRDPDLTIAAEFRAQTEAIGRVPTFHDESDGKKVVLQESGAIIE